MTGKRVPGQISRNDTSNSFQDVAYLVQKHLRFFAPASINNAAERLSTRLLEQGVTP
jgi:hypothetical protein